MKLAYYFQGNTFLILIGIAIICSVIFLLIPRDKRLGALLLLTAASVSLSNMTGLDVVFRLSKVGSVVPFVGMIAIYMFDTRHAPKFRNSQLLAFFCLLTFMTAFLLVSTVDRTEAVLLRMSYGIQLTAALLLARLSLHQGVFEYIINWISFGFYISMLVIASGFLFAYNHGFEIEHSRFVSYGLDPNHVATAILPAMAIFCYQTLNSKVKAIRILAIFFAVLCAVMIVLTLSRQAAAAAIIILLPFYIPLLRKPVVLVGAVIALALVAYLIIDRIDLSKLERLQDMHTGRTYIWMNVITNPTSYLPLGMLGTQGRHSFFMDGRAADAHSAYLFILRAFGPIFFLYYMWITINIVIKGFKAFTTRRFQAFNPQAISLMYFVLIANLATGVVAASAVWPTYLWPFIASWAGFTLYFIATQGRSALSPPPSAQHQPMPGPHRQQAASPHHTHHAHHTHHVQQ